MRYDRRCIARVLRATVCVVAIAAVSAGAALAGDEEKPAVTGKNAKVQLSGVGWVTYRYLLQDEHQRTLPGAYLSEQDMNVFDVDRVQLTADYAFDERFSWQTQVEMADNSGELKVFLKKAYIKVKDPFGAGGTFVQMGEIGHVMTPWHEKLWGHRIVAPVGIDRYLGVSTTWVGLGFGGVTANKMLDAEFAIVNEKPYNKPTQTKYKTFSGRAIFTPLPEDEALKGLKLAAWGMMNSGAPPAAYDPSASDNQNVWFGLIPSFQTDKFTIAASFDMKKDKTPSGDITAPVVKTVTSQVIAGLLTYDVAPRLKLFGRLEQYDPNTDNDDDGLMNINAGVAHTYVKGVRSIIDVEYTKYQEPSGVSFDPDVTAAARLEISL